MILPFVRHFVRVTNLCYNYVCMLCIDLPIISIMIIIIIIIVVVVVMYNGVYRQV